MNQIKDSVKRGMQKTPRKERKNPGEWKNPARHEKPGGILLMGEPKLFDTKKSVFHHGIFFLKILFGGEKM